MVANFDKFSKIISPKYACYWPSTHMCMLTLIVEKILNILNMVSKIKKNQLNFVYINDA